MHYAVCVLWLCEYRAADWQSRGRTSWKMLELRYRGRKLSWVMTSTARTEVRRHRSSTCFWFHHAASAGVSMMMMSFICFCRNKKEEPGSIYTLRKVRTIRGGLEGLAQMIWKCRMVLAAPGPLLTPPPSSSPPKTPFRSYSDQNLSQNEEKNHPVV